MKIEIRARVRTRDGRIVGEDGPIRRVDRVELDPITGELDEYGVYVKASKLDIETGLGPQSRALSGSHAR